MDLFLYDKDLRLERVKVNKSVYIAQSRQRHDVTLNKFFFHVLNHALQDL